MALELESYQLSNRWGHVHARGMARQVYSDCQTYRENSEGEVRQLILHLNQALSGWRC